MWTLGIHFTLRYKFYVWFTLGHVGQFQPIQLQKYQMNNNKSLLLTYCQSKANLHWSKNMKTYLIRTTLCASIIFTIVIIYTEIVYAFKSWSETSQSAWPQSSCRILSLTNSWWGFWNWNELQLYSGGLPETAFKTSGISTKHTYTSSYSVPAVSGKDTVQTKGRKAVRKADFHNMIIQKNEG